jgi:hypothetical protein
MQRPDLEKRIAEITSEIQGWYEIIYMKTMPYPSNPYARIEYGTIMSNGLHEQRVGYFTVYWDGTAIKSNHSV